MARILVVDDEKNVRSLVEDILSREGHQVKGAASGEEALKIVKKSRFDILVVDLRLPGIDGLGMIREMRAQSGAGMPDVIIITAHATIDAAVEALRTGVIDFLIKPFEPNALRAAVHRALSEAETFRRVAATFPVLNPRDLNIPEAMKKEIEGEIPLPFGFVGRSKELRELLRKVQDIAGTDATVLITGETGTGKELVARAIHLSSRRRDGPFVSINCAALPDTLVENELFGHERGAYTDARTRQIGKVAQAKEGTLFLDEVGDLSASAQSKLLRLIEDGEYVPLGGMQLLHADIRIVAATNRDLGRMVATGLFREDLYWRLRVIPIHIPPLRNRGDRDIEDLSNYFMEEFAKKYGKTKRPFLPGQLQAMARYSWPGNVRELRSYIEHYLLLGDESLLGKQPELPPSGSLPAHQPVPTFLSSDSPESVCAAAKQKAENLERDAIIHALKSARGNKKKAAEFLGISYRTLFYWLKRYNISTEVSIG